MINLFQPLKPKGIILNMANNIFDIYIMRVPERISLKNIYPAERNDYILSSSSEKTKLLRYGAWKALECAINNSFSFNMEDINFINNSGKWLCDKFHFSLSHTDTAVAVAVSDRICGIDIEAMSRFTRRYNNSEVLSKFEKKICSPEENIHLNTPRDFIETWTKKESIYKAYFNDAFSAKEINTRRYKTICESIILDEEYVFSCCGEHSVNYRLFIIDKDTLLSMQIK